MQELIPPHKGAAELTFEIYNRKERNFHGLKHMFAYAKMTS